MGKIYPPEEIEFYRRVDEVLHYVWDPIGIAHAVHARNEYHGYLPKVFSMLKEDSSKEAIDSYLRNVEEAGMGLDASPEQESRRTTAVNLLFDYRSLFIPPAQG